jgi:hypothetical protein
MEREYRTFFKKSLKFRSWLPITEQREPLGGGATMGISPISNLFPLPDAHAIEADLEPVPMQRVENSSRTGDETYSPSNGKSSHGSEDGTPEDEPEESSVEPEDASAESAEPRPISFFA